MAEVTIYYSALESSINFSAKSRTRIGDYISLVDSIINLPIGKLPGSDSSGYAQTAANLALQKASDLENKKPMFLNYEASIRNVITVAKDADAAVSSNMESIAETYIGTRTWYEQVGDWIYNTFCVDAVNSLTLLRAISDVVKWVADKAGNILDVIHDWFKYGDGKYVWKIVTSVVAIAAAFVGAMLSMGFVLMISARSF